VFPEILMLIREKDGRYAGEIRDFPSHIAHELIATGRAENPYVEPAPAIDIEEPRPVVQPRRSSRSS
jgi:hypothetical protein